MTTRTEDHRVRTSRLRRERMEARLLQAVTECYGERALDAPPTVEEVVRRTGVSRQTFYNYFQSIDEAIEKRASELVDDMIRSLQRMVPDDEAPIRQFTVSLRLFLARSAIDPVWGAFAARSNLMDADGELFRGMARHLTMAQAEGELSYADREAAMILAVGTMREAIRSVSRQPANREGLIDALTVMILIGVGSTRSKAERHLMRAKGFIAEIAPGRLEWWASDASD